jgi:transposase InsO family protein
LPIFQAGCPEKSFAKIAALSYDVEIKESQAFSDNRQNQNHTISQNSLDRQDEAKELNQSWTAYIIYILSLEGWLYLAVNIDLISREVVGRAIAHQMRTMLCINALQMIYLSTGYKGAENRNLVCYIIRIGVTNMQVIATDKIWKS